MKEVVRFDMKKKPIKQRWYLTPLAWLLSFPEIWSRKLKVIKTNMKGVKPPYLFLSNHMAFVDFKVATRAIFPHRANYVVAIDGFLINEWLLRQVGCICKRKFTQDLQLIKHMKYALDVNKTILALYPEARYSYTGTNSVLPDSLGKLVKMLKVPVVTFIQHGNHLSQPVWNLSKRKVRLEVEMTQIFTAEQLEKASVDEINKVIREKFVYDDYKWQKDNQIKIDYPLRAKGLHQILYQCPHCLTESQMNSDNDEIWCEHCHKRWKMDVYGELKALEGETEFSHIPDWFEFERAQVIKQVEAGTYAFEDDVIVDSLPNAKGYIRLGKAHLKHDMNGFVLNNLENEPDFYLEKQALSLYSLHIEFNYFGKGDCLDLSTLDDTYYLFPQTKTNVVTKIQFAVEAIYQIKEQERLNAIKNKK
ncbi:MAG: lysophospholipid acyltransferase family protein [Bacilli bacterium]